MTDFSFISCVLTQADEVVPGLDASALMFTRIWGASVDITVTQTLFFFYFCSSVKLNCLPISDSTSTQQKLSVSSPLPLQNNVDIKLLIVNEDVLHAAMEAIQLCLTLPYCVVRFWTT